MVRGFHINSEGVFEVDLVAMDSCVEGKHYDGAEKIGGAGCDGLHRVWAGKDRAGVPVPNKGEEGAREVRRSARYA
jgi:hypothetical protein